MKKVLFICTGNTCRSPMAHGVFVRQLQAEFPLFKQEIEVMTAGLIAHPGDKASRKAVQVMSEIGIDISSHQAQLVTEDMVRSADWIFTMTKSHRDHLIRKFGEIDRLYTLYEFIGEEKDVQDPFGQGEDVYRKCRDEIQEVILRILDKIYQEIDFS